MVLLKCFGLRTNNPASEADKSPSQTQTTGRRIASTAALPPREPAVLFFLRGLMYNPRSSKLLLQGETRMLWDSRITKGVLFFVILFCLAIEVRCQTPKDPFFHPPLYVEECVAEEKEFCVEFRARLDAWKNAILYSENPGWRWLNIGLRPELRKEGNKMFAELKLVAPGRLTSLWRGELKQGATPRQAAEATFDGFIFLLTGRHPKSSPAAGKKRRGSTQTPKPPSPSWEWVAVFFFRLFLIHQPQTLFTTY